MNITLKTEYALRALQEMIESGIDKPVSRKQIAEKRNISEHFLEKIFLNLKKHHIIKSIKGPGGGFLFARDIKDITLWDIYTAVDDPDYRVDKCYYKTTEDCEMKEDCKVKNIWYKFAKVLKESMSGIYLYDIVEEELETQ